MRHYVKPFTLTTKKNNPDRLSVNTAFAFLTVCMQLFNANKSVQQCVLHYVVYMRLHDPQNSSRRPQAENSNQVI